MNQKQSRMPLRSKTLRAGRSVRSGRGHGLSASHASRAASRDAAIAISVFALRHLCRACYGGVSGTKVGQVGRMIVLSR